MTLQEILAVKGVEVHSIHPEATLQDVVDALVEHKVGALVVCRREGGQRGTGRNHLRTRYTSCLRCRS